MNRDDELIDPLFALSSSDGRYFRRVDNLREIFSEYGLIKKRVFVEIKWFLFITKKLNIKINKDKAIKLEEKLNNFSIYDAKRIKEIEKTTNHDVKAVEYFLKEIYDENDSEFIHFGLTSEDVNNLSYALNLKEYIEKIFDENIKGLMNILKKLAFDYKDKPMLSRTHGQPATPTTFGKEISYYLKRIYDTYKRIKSIEICGKLNGATGNFASFYISYPEIDWIDLSKEFIESLGIKQNIVTIQIEPHDFIARILNEFSILDGILVDLAKDVWLYISYEYLKLKSVKTEVGSSTMPHKVNPIDFENGWGNFETSQSLCQFLSRRLIVSMMQRDLTDSTLLRNLSLCFSHFEIGLYSLIKGLEKIDLNEEKIISDLQNYPEVLAEAIQTILRKNMIKNGYEMLKEFTRGKKVNLEILRDFINKLDINPSDREKLINLTPENYTGLSAKIVEKVLKEVVF